LRDKKKKRKKGAQKKGGENSPISPPLDPRLLIQTLFWSGTKFRIDYLIHSNSPPKSLGTAILPKYININ